MEDFLGSRMKEYENISRFYLTKKCPVIIRIDGKAFHTFTRGFKKPFDTIFSESMIDTAEALCNNISGCKLAYVQSDEISLLLTDYDNVNTQPWFDNNLQKLVSISASIATFYFNKIFKEKVDKIMSTQARYETTEYLCALSKAITNGGMFDSRAFILPKEEVCNYFIWRQQDAVRNSIQSCAQYYLGKSKTYGIKCNQLQDLMFTQADFNWNDLDTSFKRGTCIIKSSVKVNDVLRSKWIKDTEIPIFTQNRTYIEKLVFTYRG